MKNNSLKVNQNNDGSFTLEWDKQDPNWKWLNELTSKEIQVIIEQAIKLKKTTEHIKTRMPGFCTKKRSMKKQKKQMVLLKVGANI